MSDPEGCRPVYCVAGPCADSCLRTDDPNPIEMPPDRLARTAARIREARDGASDGSMPDIPLARAADLYHGRCAPTARELALYAEACGVSVDWLLTGIKDGAGPASRPAKVELPPPSPALTLHQAADRLRRAAQAALDAEAAEGRTPADWYSDLVDGYLGGAVGMFCGLFSPAAGAELADWLDATATAAVRHAGAGGTQEEITGGYPIRTAQRILGEAP